MTNGLFFCVFVIVFLIIIVLFEIYRETHTFKITRYNVKSHKVNQNKESIKILFLSDLHNRTYGNSNERLYLAILDENPDLILIGGDMLVGKEGESEDVAIDFVSKLPAICPVYYANGNHEQRIKENRHVYGNLFQEYKYRLEEQGVRFLENKSDEIEIRGTKFHILGLELDSSVNRKFKKADVTVSTLEDLIGSSNNKDFTNEEIQILMAHNPAYMDSYKGWGADLILSGHLHGGLIRCPGIGGIVTPQGFFFPKYSGEMHQEGKQTIIVSRGLGSHTINIRLFNTPELIAIQLSNDTK